MNQCSVIRLGRWFLLSAGIVVAALVQAQTDHIADSLLTRLNYQRDDTSKVNTLLALSRRYWEIADIKNIAPYAGQALELSKKLNYQKGIAHAFANLGLGSASSANYREAEKYYSEAMLVYTELKDQKNIAATYLSLGTVSLHIGDRMKALEQFQNALQISEAAADSFQMAAIYSKIGTFYRERGDYELSLKNYFAALKLNQKLNHAGGIGDCYDNIGIVYWWRGELDEALKNFQLGLKVREEIGEQRAIAGSRGNIARVYVKQHKYDEALDIYKSSLEYNIKIGDRYALAATYDDMGEVYWEQEKYAEALTNFSAALKIVEVLKDKFGLAICNINSGRASVMLGRYPEARSLLQNGLNASLEIGAKENIRNAYLWLSRLDSLTGNFQQALVNFHAYTAYKDSLYNESNSRQIAQIKEQYESEKKDRELLVLNRERDLRELQVKKQKQSKNFAIAALGLFIILAFFAYRNYHNREKLKLLALRHKIASDLHDDVGSTLSSISIFSQMANQQSREVIPLMETIGESSRKMLDAMADIVWTIKPENDQFEKIVMRMRNFAYELLGAKSIDFEFMADEEVSGLKLNMEKRKNLYLIFKEAINNMVKYSNARRAMFSIKKEKNKLTMLIKDFGKGFDQNQLSAGNGLENMKKRAAEIDAMFNIYSDPGQGTTIELEMAV